MHPFPVLPNESARLDRLQHYELRALGKLSEFDVFVESACLIADCPGGLVAIMDSDNQFIQACVGLELDVLPREQTICQHTILSNKMLMIPDTLLDERSASNEIMKAAGIRFYAGIPLVDDDGFVLGTICLIDYKPKQLTDKQIQSLNQLAAGVSKIYVSNKISKQSDYFIEMFKSTQNIVCILDTDGYIKDSNPSFKDFFESPDTSLLGKHFSDFISETNKFKFCLDKLSVETLSFSDEFLVNSTRQLNVEWFIHRHNHQGEIFCFGRNITNELEEKIKLENSEKKFRNFFENSIGLVSMHDLSGNLLSVNQKGRELLGYTANEVKNINLKNLLSPNHEGDLQKYLERILVNKEDSGLMVLLNKSGEDTFWFYHNSLECDVDGAAYVVSTALNMTDRILLEKDLLRTKQLLEHTSAVAEVGGWELDLENQTLYWSDTTYKIHKVDPGHPVSIDEAMQFYEPTYSLPLISTAFNEAITTGKNYDLELQLIQSTGELIWVRAKGIPVFENDICKRVFGIIQNIDESKNLYLELDRQKSMLQYFVSDVPACVAMFDRNLDCIIVSNQWIDENFGKHMEVSGMHLFDIFPNVPEERKLRYRNALEGVPYKCMDEVLFVPKYDEPQHFNWEIRPWRLGNGEIGGIVVFSQNITHLVKANDEYKIAKRNADLANRAKTEFLANMSHEIRTPLNGVIGFSDLLLKTPLNDLQKQYLNYINESGNSLLNIINDILDFSKIESGKLELYITKYNLYDLANQVINVVLYQAQNKKIELLLNIDQSLPSYVWCDEVRIKQVLINLLSNAVKFTESGEIELKVSLLSIEEEEATVKFEVRDTGIGIPADRQERIFNAFTQEDSSVSKRYGGTGLGLTISNNILRYMNSHLQVESQVNEGSTFSFELRLPFEFESLPEYDVLEQVKKVLIVDDNAHNLIILQKMLAHKKIDVEMAANGMEALHILMRCQDFDIIMVDYFMPILTGVETIEKIKELFKLNNIEVPLIILHTSSEDEEVKQKLNQHGEFWSLLKPIRSQALYDTLRTALRSQQEDRTSELVMQEDANLLQEIHVLIADDNPVNMALNKRMMNNILPNAILYEANDGLEAINHCAIREFDLILMDVQMPEVDGIEATKQIRQMEAFQDIPIIGITAGNIKGEREKCIEAGMSEFLAKPIKQNQLYDTIKGYIQQFEMKTVSDEDIVHINYDIIDENTGDDLAFKKYFLELVIEELNSKVLDFQRAIANDNYPDLAHLLHKLKGTAATAGLQHLHKLTIDLEDKLKQGLSINNTTCKQLYEEIDLILNKINTNI